MTGPFDDATLRIASGPDGPSIRFSGLRQTHQQSRWYATGFCVVTYKAEYSDQYYLNHVLQLLPDLDREIERAIHHRSGELLLNGHCGEPLQVVDLTLSPLREPDGRILVFFAVTMEPMPRVRRRRKKGVADGDPR